MTRFEHAFKFLNVQLETRTFIEEARRSQIVACAIEVIATLGYANASLAKIAKLAKVSTGVISYHFDGKDELIQAVVAEVAGIATDLMTPRIVAQATATDALRVYIEANLEFMRLHPKPLLALVEIVTHSRAGDGGPGPYAAQHEIAIADLEKVLTWGRRTGEFRDFDLRTMAIAIRGAIDAIPAQIVVFPDLDIDHLARELTVLFMLATRSDV
ncbi:TetR/AcrR family transcriptional regulator [Streptosporangium subroseum]|uniref:TetR/AcrR family transcriptional regulator n=1 Tax=Streptosporangium subroseum TaxID=106412 RepID=UPI0030931008|nr:TetR family transcriptional regulator [Streptosporangium subroseum]